MQPVVPDYRPNGPLHGLRVVDMTPPKQADRYLEESELLDVGVAVFEANVPDDFDERTEQLIMPEVRRAEAQFFPYFFKNLVVPIDLRFIHGFIDTPP